MPGRGSAKKHSSASLSFAATAGSANRSTAGRRKAATAAQKALPTTDPDDDDEGEAGETDQVMVVKKPAGGGKKRAREIEAPEEGEEEGGVPMVPTSSSHDFDELARKLKAKQARAMQAKRSAFEADARARIAAMAQRGEDAVKERKASLSAVVELLEHLCKDPGDDQGQSKQHAAKKSTRSESDEADSEGDEEDDLTLQLSLCQSVLETFQKTLESEEDLGLAYNELEKRPTIFRRLAKEATNDAKALCRQELEMLTLQAGAKSFVDKYHDMMTTAMSDP